MRHGAPKAPAEVRNRLRRARGPIRYQRRRAFGVSSTRFDFQGLGIDGPVGHGLTYDGNPGMEAAEM